MTTTRDLDTPPQPDHGDFGSRIAVFGRPDNDGSPVVPVPKSEIRNPKPEIVRRLTSLDAFRGLTILGMLLVNNTALDSATPRQLTHAPWNQGIHLADLVFPWFLLIMGVAIPYAAASHRRKGLPLWKHHLKALGRAVMLVLLGCLIDSSLAHRPVFNLGVLQLIGLAYLVAALLYEWALVPRLLLAAGLLTAHWAAIRLVPIPGVGAGAFTEDTNLIHYLNEVYLRQYHLAGLISIAPTSALALIGTVLGDALRREPEPPMPKVARLLAWGLGLIGAGWLWSLDLPFNKPVWTASYILFTAGWGAVVLGLFYLLIDAGGRRAWAFPLVVPGMNAIVAYVVPILVKIYVLQEWHWKMPDGSSLSLQQAFLHACTAFAGRIPGGWLFTLSYILFWWLVLFQMYRKQLFLRI